MANPIIDSITVTPDPVPSGQTATITVVAHDPDAQTVTFDVTVTDSAGNTATGQVTGSVADPLTFAVAASSGTVLPGSQPNEFTWSE